MPLLSNDGSGYSFDLELSYQLLFLPLGPCWDVVAFALLCHSFLSAVSIFPCNSCVHSRGTSAARPPCSFQTVYIVLIWLLAFPLFVHSLWLLPNTVPRCPKLVIAMIDVNNGLSSPTLGQSPTHHNGIQKAEVCRLAQFTPQTSNRMLGAKNTAVWRCASMSLVCIHPVLWDRSLRI